MAQEPERGAGRRIGPYELIDKIGRGGMSTVFKARDTRSDDVVAVKVAARAVISDPHLSRRFELEYALAKPLTHQHLVKILEYGNHEKIPYLAMEFVDGPSLGKRIKEQGKLTEHEALPIVLQVGEALAYLHRKQIIHRDIKPANILVTSTSNAKLADLGLLKNLDSLSRLTHSHMGLGTLDFVSPEQFEDARGADARSDVYSLAATLYATLVGKPPFDGGAIVMLERKLRNEFETPISRLPELRPSVDAAIRLALDADPGKRPATCEEFIALLTGAKKLADDAILPGLTKAPGSKLGPKEGERRSVARYPTEFEAQFRSVNNARRWTSTVRDLSVSGACLLAKRRFEVGNVVEITFADDDSAATQFARIRWVTSGAAGVWLLGCEFAAPLSNEDLDAICNLQMGRTAAIKNK